MKWKAVEPKMSRWSSELAGATEAERQAYEGTEVVDLVVRDANGKCWRYCTFSEKTRALQVEEVR